MKQASTGILLALSLWAGAAADAAATDGAEATDPLADLDALAATLKAQPAGAVDEDLARHIGEMKERRLSLRRTRDRLELERRKCGSMPVGPCRSALQYLKREFDALRDRLAMDRMKLQALVFEREAALRERAGPGGVPRR